MLRDSLDAFLQSSTDVTATSDTRITLGDKLGDFVAEAPDLALSVCQRDDRIDDLTAQIFNTMLSQMRQEPEYAPRALRILFISKYLERVADHATNIAEMVIYLAKGKSIRHLSPLPESV